MPLDYTAVQHQLHDLSDQLLQRKQLEEAHADQAAVALDSLTGQNEQSRRKIEQATAGNAGLRTAVPTEEEISAVILPKPQPADYTLFAADGSQVHPSRHDATPFGVINIGVFCMTSTMQTPPSEIVETHLLTADELYNDFGLVGEDVIALQRDLSERRLLAGLARDTHGTVVTLTDGPLELFRDPENSADTRTQFNEYLDVLRQLAQQDTITAGYVDRPGSDLVVRMLEILRLPGDELSKAGHDRPFLPLTDAFLFYSRLTGGARSAIFRIQSRAAQQFKDETALHFFYLNTGTTEQPALARVEIPAWVADKAQSVNLLHTILLDQCQHLGANPYPYALHRSHEIALVSLMDKDQIENMINRVLVTNGLPPGRPSNKQFAKNLPGRTRNR